MLSRHTRLPISGRGRNPDWLFFYLAKPGNQGEKSCFEAINDVLHRVRQSIALSWLLVRLWEALQVKWASYSLSRDLANDQQITRKTIENRGVWLRSRVLKILKVSLSSFWTMSVYRVTCMIRTWSISWICVLRQCILQKVHCVHKPVNKECVARKGSGFKSPSFHWRSPMQHWWVWILLFLFTLSLKLAHGGRRSSKVHVRYFLLHFSTESKSFLWECGKCETESRWKGPSFKAVPGLAVGPVSVLAGAIACCTSVRPEDPFAKDKFYRRKLLCLTSREGNVYPLYPPLRRGNRTYESWERYYCHGGSLESVHILIAVESSSPDLPFNRE